MNGLLWRCGEMGATLHPMSCAAEAVTNFPDQAADGSYMYDGLGKGRMIEVTKTSGGSVDKTWIRWDLGWNPLAVYEDDAGGFWDIGDMDVSCVHDPIEPSMSPLAIIVGADPEEGLYIGLFKDHLGSTRRMRFAIYDNASLAAYEYTPYGELYSQSGDTPGFGFTGHLFDPDMGMYYAPYRYYTPATARWLTRDPAGMVDGPNMYAYVRGNAVNGTDPLGNNILLSVREECDRRIDDCVAAYDRCKKAWE